MQKYDYKNNIGFIVNRTAKAFAKAFDTELRDKVGVTFSQWKVIVMLVNQNGLTQKEIADKLGFANTDTAKTKKYKCKQKLDELVKSQYSEQDFLD